MGKKKADKDKALSNQGSDPSRPSDADAADQAIALPTAHSSFSAPATEEENQLKEQQRRTMKTTKKKWKAGETLDEQPSAPCQRAMTPDPAPSTECAEGTTHANRQRIKGLKENARCLCRNRR